jgi:hypothetical protein
MLKSELIRLIKKGIAKNIKVDFENRTIEAYFPPVLAELNKFPPVYFGDGTTRLLNVSEEDLIIFSKLI